MRRRLPPIDRVLLLAGWLFATPALADPPTVEVYKTATCDCCRRWAEHLRDNGFTVGTTDVADLRAVKDESGIPPALSSCHTAFVGGYFVEGHVPVADVKRLLAERPTVRGIAVPGMPIGSPGMEGPGAQPYDVLVVDPAGKATVFSTHRP